MLHRTPLGSQQGSMYRRDRMAYLRDSTCLHHTSCPQDSTFHRNSPRNTPHPGRIHQERRPHNLRSGHRPLACCLVCSGRPDSTHCRHRQCRYMHCADMSRLCCGDSSPQCSHIGPAHCTRYRRDTPHQAYGCRRAAHCRSGWLGRRRAAHPSCHKTGHPGRRSRGQSCEPHPGNNHWDRSQVRIGRSG
jgi:hypothetical protein